tara:strand:- start:118 stop:468 length:351 start_codon:yes stop_codon:yes gene_type:complete
MTKIYTIFLTFLLFLITPKIVNSAEILQINSSESVLIGDQNRNLKVNLACIKVNEVNQLNATELLKNNFPRGTKVKIRPYGKKDNTLLAKVYNLKNNIEMTELLVSANLTGDNCAD